MILHPRVTHKRRARGLDRPAVGTQGDREPGDRQPGEPQHAGVPGRGRGPDGRAGHRGAGLPGLVGRAGQAGRAGLDAEPAEPGAGEAEAGQRHGHRAAAGHLPVGARARRPTGRHHGDQGRRASHRPWPSGCPNGSAATARSPPSRPARRSGTCSTPPPNRCGSPGTSPSGTCGSCMPRTPTCPGYGTGPCSTPAYSTHRCCGSKTGSPSPTATTPTRDATGAWSCPRTTPPGRSPSPTPPSSSNPTSPWSSEPTRRPTLTPKPPKWVSPGGASVEPSRPGTDRDLGHAVAGQDPVLRHQGTQRPGIRQGLQEDHRRGPHPPGRHARRLPQGDHRNRSRQQDRLRREQSPNRLRERQDPQVRPVRLRGELTPSGATKTVAPRLGCHPFMQRRRRGTLFPSRSHVRGP